jgi:succinate-acetate transporter protein
MVMPKFGMGVASSPIAMECFLGMWGLFTLLMFIGTLRLSRALQVVFGTLTLLYFLLVLGDATESAAVKQFAGFEGLICGFSAIYAGIAQVLNEVYGRTLLPLGLVKK